MAMSRSKEPTDFIEPDGKELRRLMWKIDLRIVPLVSLMYLCSFLDRINIGNAKLAGLMDDMSITNSEYHWALSIFFVGYLIFEVPSNLMLKFAGPRLWLSIILLVWGVIMASMATCRTGAGLIAARFFLGVAESGLFPGIIFYLSVWYTKRQLALRIAVFYGSSTLAGAFGGIIAYGIVQMHGIGGLSGWQWIFIIEAIPTLVLGALTYVVLPNFPENTTFLNERERAIIADQKKRDAGVAADATNFTWKQVGSTMIDWKVYAFSLIFFCGALLMYSLSMFMPSIVHGMGYTSLTAQAMSSPPYAFAFVWCLFVAWHADRQGERGFHMACSITLSIIGYTILITLRDKSPLILYIVLFSPLHRHCIITTLGNIGGAIGGQLYRADDAPRYVKGNTACLAISCCLVVLPITIKYIFYKINKKRDNMAPEKLRAICENSEDLGEKHPGFRYTL